MIVNQPLQALSGCPKTNLFVTTNENQNYQFPEDEIDIEAALAELERMA